MEAAKAAAMDIDFEKTNGTRSAEERTAVEAIHNWCYDAWWNLQFLQGTLSYKYRRQNNYMPPTNAYVRTDAEKAVIQNSFGNNEAERR